MSPALDLGDLNDLNDDVVVEVDVKEALKSSIFIVQKAAAPKSGVEFRQSSNGTTSSLRKNLVLKRFLYRNFETKIKFGQQDFRAKSIWCATILVHKTFGPKYILIINNFGQKNVFFIIIYIS